MSEQPNPDFQFQARMIFDFPFYFVENSDRLEKLQEYRKEIAERIEEILGVQAVVKDDLELTINMKLK
jgi:hypothetical protein